MYIGKPIRLVMMLMIPLLPAVSGAEETLSGMSGTLSSAPIATPQLQEVTPAPVTSGTTSDQGAKPAAEVPASPTEKPADQGLVDYLHGEISTSLLATATWLDSFFADERALKEENNSYIRAHYDVFREERSKTTRQPSFDVRMVLPQLQKKTHLVFSAEPTETLRSPTTPVGATGAQITPAEERNVTAAIHYLYRMTPQESFIIRTGGQISKGKPVVFVAPRYRSYLPFGMWGFRFSEEALYRTDTKWQTNTSFDLERTLPYDLFYRANLTGIWLQGTKGYFYYLGCSLRQPFDPVHAVQYEWVSSYQTIPTNELMDIAFRVRYRQSFWRRWLFFELAPQYRFPRERNFNGTPGIMFKFEVFFGRQL